MWDQWEAVKSSLGARSWFPISRYTTIYLSYFADTETPFGWEKSTVNNGMLPTNMQIPDQLEPESLWCRLPLTSTPTNEKNVRKLTMSSLNNYCKTSHYLPQVGTHSFEIISPLLAPFARQNNKAFLFYFTQISVSKIWFGTGVQRNWAFSIKLMGWMNQRTNVSCLVVLNK